MPTCPTFEVKVGLLRAEPRYPHLGSVNLPSLPARWSASEPVLGAPCPHRLPSAYPPAQCCSVSAAQLPGLPSRLRCPHGCSPPFPGPRSVYAFNGFPLPLLSELPADQPSLLAGCIRSDQYNLLHVSFFLTISPLSCLSEMTPSHPGG